MGFVCQVARLYKSWIIEQSILTDIWTIRIDICQGLTIKVFYNLYLKINNNKKTSSVHESALQHGVVTNLRLANTVVAYVHSSILWDFYDTNPVGEDTSPLLGP